MFRAAIAVGLFLGLLAPIGVQAAYGTNGRAVGARHDFHDVARVARARRDDAGDGAFDGAWNVSSDGFCSASGVNQVVILGHSISGQGLVGTVSSSGAIHTISTFYGLSIVGDGRISGGSAAGSYRQSDGCSGRWSAYKL